MKRQIRRSCFETNSSSTHAICIAKADVDKSSFPNHVTFTHGDFGWENEEYWSLWSKASYFYIKQFVVVMKKVRDRKS